MIMLVEIAVGLSLMYFHWLFLTLNPIRLGSKFFLFTGLGVMTSIVYTKWLHILQDGLNLQNTNIFSAAIQTSIFETIFLLFPTAILLLMDFSKYTKGFKKDTPYLYQFEANFCFGLASGVFCYPFFSGGPASELQLSSIFLNSSVYLVCFFALFHSANSTQPTRNKLHLFFTILGCFCFLRLAMSLESALTFYASIFNDPTLAFKGSLLRFLVGTSTLSLSLWIAMRNQSYARKSFQFLRCISRKRHLLKRVKRPPNYLLDLVRLSKQEQNCLMYLFTHLCILWFAQDFLETINLHNYLSLVCTSLVFAVLIVTPKKNLRDSILFKLASKRKPK